MALHSTEKIKQKILYRGFQFRLSYSLGAIEYTETNKKAHGYIRSIVKIERATSLVKY